MSEFIKRDIADYIIAALAANTALDAVRMFVRGGAPFQPALDQHPYIEVEIGQETAGDDLTGGVHEQTYIGLITVNVSAGNIAGGDWLDVYGDRIARVPSYDQVEELISAIMLELQRDAHATLGNLATATEVVYSFQLTGPRVYGLDDRSDNFTNFGSLPFEVTTQRSV